ncbi:hypothetical protein [Terriglobus saanensis]|uniref:hypothetical protein n=1 Tax=Terriglobus saanensis TaxID=870903 RepID=UPI000311583B|nr:hypothetical protein [Terriglobus saanensis]
MAEKRATALSHSLPEMWHLLSLDAPLVAIVWTCLLSWSVDATPTLPEVCALGLAVWMLYALDRLLDSLRGKHPLEDRHRFHRLHWRGFVFTLALAIPLESWIVLTLPHNIRFAWMLLGVPLVAYLLLIHLTSLRPPKEFIVALFFAAACIMPAAIRVGVAPLLGGGSLFALLCWTNCVAIARWEKDVQPHPMTEWAACNLRSLCGAIVLGAGILFLVNGSSAVAGAASVSALALWAADVSWGVKGSRLRMRVLADAVLLTPIASIAGMPALRQHTFAHLLTILPHLHAATLR